MNYDPSAEIAPGHDDSRPVHCETWQEPQLLLDISPEARRLVPPLPRLPNGFLILLAHVLRPEVSASDIVEDISRDARLTAELLRLVNHSAFGRTETIVRVPHAVEILTARRAASLVANACLIRNQSRIAPRLSQPLRLWFQRRSVISASAAAVFARRQEHGALSAETACVLGLLQDLGILLMAQTFGDRYVPLLERTRRVARVRLDTLERQSFGVTHAEVSAALLQQWEFPQTLILPTLYHESLQDREALSDARSIPPFERGYLAAMHFGERFAMFTDHETPDRQHLLQQTLQEVSESNTVNFNAIRAESFAMAVELSQIFSIPVPDQPAHATSAVIPSRSGSKSTTVGLGTPTFNPRSSGGSRQPTAIRIPTRLESDDQR